MNKERIYWLAWSQISKIGPISLNKIYQHFGSLAEAWETPVNAFGAIDGFGVKLLNIIKVERSKINPEEFIEKHIQKNPNFWTPADEEYPRLLLEIPSPPPVLYYQGKINLNENKGITPLIGIVGTRKPTQHGCRWTRLLSATLAKHGFTIVSGMAGGIDAHAHSSCLDSQGRTIAVLGTGVDTIYPSSNRKLYQQIQEKGLLLSEYPAGTKPISHNFPPRNRIIAGLSRAILVTEAPEKSGALITAKYANEFGKDVYTLPNSPDVESARGCLRLLNQGASIIINERELLEALGTIPQLDNIVKNTEEKLPQLSIFEEEKSQPLPDLDPDVMKVYQCISTEAMAFDLILERSNLKQGDVSSAITILEVLGLIEELPGLRYKKL